MFRAVNPPNMLDGARPGERVVRERIRQVVDALATLGVSEAAQLLADLDERWDWDRWWRQRRPYSIALEHTADAVISCIGSRGHPVAMRQACARCGRQLVLGTFRPRLEAFYAPGATIFEWDRLLREGELRGPDAPRVVPCRAASVLTLHPVRLVAYLRVSTRRQADDGYGLDVQEAEIRRWARKHRHKIIAWHTDTAASGADDLRGRPALEHAFGDVPDHAGGIVVSRLDRLARDLVLQEQLLAEMRSRGGRLHSTVADEDRLLEPDTADDPTRTFVRQVLSAAQQYERALIRLRMNSGKARKREAGGYAEGRPPYGWRAVGRELVADVDEQKVIRQIKRLRDHGRSLRQIGAELEDQGIRTRAGNPWHPNTIAGVLRRADAPRRRRAG